MGANSPYDRYVEYDRSQHPDFERFGGEAIAFSYALYLLYHDN